MTDANIQPFVAEKLEEVPLERSPLERVYTQVRFPLLATVARMEAVADFQEALGGTFPHLAEEHEVGIVLTAEGAKPLTKENVVWRLHDEERRWNLTLSPTFVTLDTAEYGSRTEFVEQLELVLEALASTFDPKGRTRLGVRYVNRIAHASLDEEIHGLVRREVLGVAASDPIRDSGKLKLSISETLFALGDDQLRTRSAILPERASVPSLQLDPVDDASWVLDLDMFTDADGDFDPTEIKARCIRFSECIYRYFRWSVTDEFLRLCGGKP